MEDEIEERIICCCGSSRWAKLIGWLQIIGSILAFVYLGVVLMSLTFQYPRMREEKLGIMRYTPVAVLAMLVAISSLIMAIVLLSGIRDMKSRQVNAWLIYATFLVVLWVISVLAQFGFVPEEPIFPRIRRLILGLTIAGFCLWVVRIHKRDIENSSGRILA